MSCERFRNALTEVAAGEPAAPALDAHLAGCDGCRSELTQLRQLMAAADESLSALATAEPSPALRVRIREAAMLADPGPTPLPPWRWSWAWPVAAAALLALAVFGLRRATVVPVPAPAPAVARSARPAPPAAEPAVDPFLAADAVATPGVATMRGARGTRREVHPAGPLPSTVTAEPEVLVPAGQQEALLQFVALVHREGLHVPTLAAAGQPLADLAGPAAIDIRPLEIVPLDLADSSGTD